MLALAYGGERCTIMIEIWSDFQGGIGARERQCSIRYFDEHHELLLHYCTHALLVMEWECHRTWGHVSSIT